MENLTIIHPFNPFGERVGGIGTFIKGLIKYVPDDISVSLIGLVNKDEVLPLREWSDVNIAGKNVPFYPVMVEKDENARQWFPLAIRFTWNLFLRRIDLRGHDLFFHRFEPAILFLNNRNRKFFVFHNDIDKFLSKKDSEVLWAKIPHVYLLLEKWIYKFADKVLTVNGNSLSFYLERYARNRDKFDFIPTWVDSDVFHPPLGAKSGVREKVAAQYDVCADKRWVLYVGRLQKQKCPEKLIELLAKLENNEQLLIVGDGNLREPLESLAQDLGVMGRIHFLGTMGQEQLRELYQSADLFLLTSNFEGMPMCVLEAQACGLPVVTTPVGEVARVVNNKKSGIVTADHEVETLTQAAITVLSDPDTYSEANCLAAVSDYTAEKVVGRMMELFYAGK